MESLGFDHRAFKLSHEVAHPLTTLKELKIRMSSTKNSGHFPDTVIIYSHRVAAFFFQNRITPQN